MRLNDKLEALDAMVREEEVSVQMGSYCLTHSALCFIVIFLIRVYYRKS